MMGSVTCEDASALARISAGNEDEGKSKDEDEKEDTDELVPVETSTCREDEKGRGASDEAETAGSETSAETLVPSAEHPDRAMDVTAPHSKHTKPTERIKQFFPFEDSRMTRTDILNQAGKNRARATASQKINGRGWATQLERLRVYHREHGNLGKRYIEVIRAFNPKYVPHTESELAQLSRSLMPLTIT